MSNISDDFIQVGSMLHLLYSIKMIPEEVEKTEDGGYIIWYKGEKRKLSDDAYIIDFMAEEQITMEEAMNLLRGTKGIKSIKGEFKY